MDSLGPCFHAPRHEPETCPHKDEWRFSWCVDEPATLRGKPALQTVQIVVCMACDRITEGVVRRPWIPTREYLEHVYGVSS